MTMQSYGPSTITRPRSLIIESAGYRFFDPDFFELDRPRVFDADDFDPDDFLLPLVRLAALPPAVVLEADLFELEAFLLEDLDVPRCLRAFSASISSPKFSISSALKALLAFLKSWPSSSSTWCSTFSCNTLACASHSSFADLALLNWFSRFLTTSCSS